MRSHIRSCILALPTVALSALIGCASYQNKVAVARDAMRNHDYPRAIAELEPLAAKSNDDQLVYLLDYATVLQQAGRHKESMQAFARAERIADIQDYHSLTNIASSLVLSETMVQYKGDDFEKVMINAINSINYLETGDLDEALVEVRKLNQKLYKYKTEAKRDYEQNPFAYYLSGVIWEADRKWDDAYIAYKSAYELIPNFEPLHEDLLRLAQKADRSEDLAAWKKKFPETKLNPAWKDKSTGELVFIFEQGWGPRKRPRPENPRFPFLMPVANMTRSARLVVKGPQETKQARITENLFNVGDVAIKTLNDDYARLIASRVGGIVTKAVLADQLRQKNEALGLIAWVAMNAADQADLRQWSTLPETLQIARVPLKPGKYRIAAEGLGGLHQTTGESMPEREIEIKPGKKVFVSWRSFR